MDPLDEEFRRLEYPRPASGPFVYCTSWGDDGYLSVDNFSRCNTDRLMHLLTYVQPPPLLTKAGKPRVRRPPPHKDETARFYSAQCVHYGLTATSDKHSAKAKLLKFAEANGKKFIVPPEVKELEKTLAAEYAAKKAIYNAKVTDIKARRKKTEESKPEKRKRADGELRDLVSKKPKYAAKAIANLQNVRAAFAVSAPKISDNWEADDLTLRLCTSSSGRHIWGDFDFGVVEGTLRSEKLPQPFSGLVKFYWRGRETGEGESTYGIENIVKLRFLDEKTFQGTMYWDCAGELELAGKVDLAKTRNCAFAKIVRQWKDAYRELNDSNYEEESRKRWSSGGYGSGSPDAAAESDTTDGGLSGNEDELDPEDADY